MPAHARDENEELQQVREDERDRDPDHSLSQGEGRDPQHRRRSALGDRRERRNNKQFPSLEVGAEARGKGPEEHRGPDDQDGCL